MKIFKVTLLIIFTLIAFVFCFKTRFIKILEDKGYLIKCYDREESFLDIYSQEGFDYLKEDQKTVINSFHFLENSSKLSSINSIPRITHQVYLSSEQNSISFNDFYKSLLINNYSNLAGKESWVHYLWVNNEDNIPHEIKKIKGVKILSIDQLKNKDLFFIVEEILDKAKKNKAYFTEAADLIRLMVVNEFGGIYMDLDYEIYNSFELQNFIEKFDFVGGREMTIKLSNYGNAFFAAKAGHPIIKEALHRIKRNHDGHNLANYLKYPCKESTRIYFNGPPLLTMSYFQENNKATRDIILPAWMVFNARFARFKNKTCSYDQVNIEEFNAQIFKLEKLMSEYRKNPIAEGPEEVAIENIYYRINYNEGYEIIGADMFCGNWIQGSKLRKKYYWNFKLD